MADIGKENYAQIMLHICYFENTLGGPQPPCSPKQLRAELLMNYWHSVETLS